MLTITAYEPGKEGLPQDFDAEDSGRIELKRQ